MADPSTPNPVIMDLNDEEHTDFIKTFQTAFDIFYCTSAARVRGAQKLWVIKHVMGPFQQKFGPCSETLLKKIDRFLRNHTRCNQKALDPIDLPSNTPRAVSWMQVMSDDRKDDIKTRISDLRDAEGVESKGDFLRYFHRARQEMMDSLEEAEIEEYKKLAKIETDLRKAPPTPAEVFKLHNMLATLIGCAIRGRLGWEAPGQVGDAVCFFGVAYRTQDQNIKSQFSVVSNHHLPQQEMMIPEMINKFREHVNPTLQALTDKILPRSEIQLPKLELDIDATPPKVLRENLLQYIIASWLLSGVNANRTAENLPWEELGTLCGQRRYLTNDADFTFLGFFNPAAESSLDTVCKFAEKLMSIQISPLFKLLSPPGTLPLASLPGENIPNLEFPGVSVDDIIQEQEQPASSEPNKVLQPTLPTSSKVDDPPGFTSTPPPTSPVINQVPLLTPAPPYFNPRVNQPPSFTSAPPPTGPIAEQLLSCSSSPPAILAPDLAPVIPTLPTQSTIAGTSELLDSGGDVSVTPPTTGEGSLTVVTETGGGPVDAAATVVDATGDVSLGKRRRNAKVTKSKIVYSPKKLRTRTSTTQQPATTSAAKQSTQTKKSRK